MSTADAFTAADHVTEREPGPWRDCTFASGLEVFRDGFPDGRSIPATIVEKEALRAAAGLPDDHTGATIAQLVTAAERRYSLAGGYRITGDWEVVRRALMDPASRCVVQGSMGSVPVHLRRWSSFTGAHAVAARGTTWCDPLAPSGSYVGEFVSLAVWESYWRGLPGAQAFVTTTGGLARGNPMLKVTDPTPIRCDLAANAQLYDLNLAPVKKVTVANDVYSPFVSGVNRAVVFTTGGVTQLLLIRTADTRNPKPVGDVKHTVTVQVDGNPVSTTEV